MGAMCGHFAMCGSYARGSSQILYIYTSVNPCISMHGAEQSKAMQSDVVTEHSLFEQRF